MKFSFFFFAHFFILGGLPGERARLGGVALGLVAHTDIEESIRDRLGRERRYARRPEVRDIVAVLIHYITAAELDKLVCTPGHYLVLLNCPAKIPELGEIGTAARAVAIPGHLRARCNAEKRERAGLSIQSAPYRSLGGPSSLRTASCINSQR